nr:CRISPR-associated endonuclease Cas1 [uncultured Rhodopila sp.]
MDKPVSTGSPPGPGPGPGPGPAAASPLWDRLCTYDSLDTAWSKVWHNRGGPGGDGVTVAAFARSAAPRLSQLLRDLRQGTYFPGPPRHVRIPKRRGGTRPLAIPCVADRVVQTALAEILAPRLDREMEDASFAYRPGRSVDQAVARIALLRRQGYRWVVESDIERYFDSVPHDRLRARLARSVPEPRILALVDLWLGAMQPEGFGLPQGGPLSPLLANLYLDDVDERIESHGVRLVRFADDFVLLCRDQAGAEAALGRMQALLAEHGLRLHPDKTHIVPFERSFRFLGHLFVRSVVLRSPDAEPDSEPPDPFVPPPEADSGAAAAPAAGTGAPLPAPDAGDERDAAEPDAGLAPVLRVLYLHEPGRVLDARHETFLVQEDGRTILAVHASRVDRIDIGPACAAADAALRLALAADIPLSFVSAGGDTLGLLGAPVRNHAALHLAQARHALDPALRADMARRIVTGRLRNQRALLSRLNRRRKDTDVAAAIETLGRALHKLPGRAEVAALMGLEGAATAIYWRALARTLAPGWTLPRRRRRPPPDPVNLVISFLATLLHRDIAALVLRHGLHPGIGMLHSSQDGKAACAFDLIEEFRAPLAEGLAVYLLNNRILKPEMFSAEDGGCRVDGAGRRAIVRGYEAKLDGALISPRGGTRTLWRGLMQEQVLAYRAHLTGGAPYAPYDMDY